MNKQTKLLLLSLHSKSRLEPILRIPTTINILLMQSSPRCIRLVPLLPLAVTTLSLLPRLYSAISFQPALPLNFTLTCFVQSRNVTFVILWSFTCRVVLSLRFFLRPTYALLHITSALCNSAHLVGALIGSANLVPRCRGLTRLSDI